MCVYRCTSPTCLCVGVDCRGALPRRSAALFMAWSLDEARLTQRRRRWLVLVHGRRRGQWRSDVGAVPGRPAACETRTATWETTWYAVGSVSYRQRVLANACRDSRAADGRVIWRQLKVCSGIRGVCFRNQITSKSRHISMKRIFLVLPFCSVCKSPRE